MFMVSNGSGVNDPYRTYFHDYSSAIDEACYNVVFEAYEAGVVEDMEFYEYFLPSEWESVIEEVEQYTGGNVSFALPNNEIVMITEE